MTHSVVPFKDLTIIIDDLIVSNRTTTNNKPYTNKQNYHRAPELAK